VLAGNAAQAACSACFHSPTLCDNCQPGFSTGGRGPRHEADLVCDASQLYTTCSLCMRSPRTPLPTKHNASWMVASVSVNRWLHPTQYDEQSAFAASTPTGECALC
jgi:hypothetical protein